MTSAVAEVLARRARALAAPRVADDDTAAADRMEILVFLIGDERLAMSLSSIIAITHVGIVAPLPRAVLPVYGVTAWRGRPLTVLSLGTKQALDGAERRLIVLGDDRRARVGMLVDSIDDTRLVARSALSQANVGARRAMTLGVTDDAILVLDAEAMLNAARSEP
jgi:chemotaxis signal transduction protein